MCPKYWIGLYTFPDVKKICIYCSVIKLSFFFPVILQYTMYLFLKKTNRNNCENKLLIHKIRLNWNTFLFCLQGELFSEFRQKFREISHLMDCMGCERCKVSSYYLSISPPYKYSSIYLYVSPFFHPWTAGNESLNITLENYSVFIITLFVKVWGKLQVTGIGTALKILFTPLEEIKLTRHEVVALVNAFGRVSTSLIELEKFRD